MEILRQVSMDVLHAPSHKGEERVIKAAHIFTMLTHSPSEPSSNREESLKSTPTLLSHSWYPRPYLSE